MVRLKSNKREERWCTIEVMMKMCYRAVWSASMQVLLQRVTHFLFPGMSRCFPFKATRTFFFQRIQLAKQHNTHIALSCLHLLCTNILYINVWKFGPHDITKTMWHHFPTQSDKKMTNITSTHTLTQSMIKQFPEKYGNKQWFKCRHNTCSHTLKKKVNSCLFSYFVENCVLKRSIRLRDLCPWRDTTKI